MCSLESAFSGNRYGNDGAVAPVLLEALLGEEGMKAVPTLSAALGGVFASWLSWVVSAKTRSS